MPDDPFAGSPLPLHTPPTAPGLILPFVQPGDLFLLAGAAGAGKSTLAADLICAAALPPQHTQDGNCLGGLFRVDYELLRTSADLRPQVAVIDAEGTEHDWARFCRRSIEARGLPWDPSSPVIQRFVQDVRHIHARETGLSNRHRWTEAAVETAERLAEQQYRLVIMDPAVAVFSPLSLNSEDWVIQAMRPLRDALKNLGLTLVILTHTARALPETAMAFRGRPQGSGTQEAACDVLLSVERVGHPDGIRLLWKKDRRAWWIKDKVDSFARLAWGPDGGGYEVIDDPGWHHNPPKDWKHISFSEHSKNLLWLLNKANDWQPQLETFAKLGVAKATAHEAKRGLLRHRLIQEGGSRGRGGKRLRITPLGQQQLERLNGGRT